MKNATLLAAAALAALGMSGWAAADDTLGKTKPEAAMIIRLAFSAEGQTKLGLDENQKAKVGQVKEGWDAKMAQVLQEFKQKLAAVLTDEQRKKLAANPEKPNPEKVEHFQSVLSGKAEKELKLTADQKAKLTPIRKDFATQAAANVQEFKNKVLEVMTAEQKTKIAEMVKEKAGKKTK